MANLAGELPLTINLDGASPASRTRYAWTGGGLVLTITTVIADPELAFELTSSYTAGPGTDTIATHVTLARGAENQLHTLTHPGSELHPVDLARACAYNHAHRLLDALNDHGALAHVQLDDSTFVELERIE